MRLFIEKPLAVRAFDRQRGALAIIDAKRRAMRVAERELV